MEEIILTKMNKLAKIKRGSSKELRRNFIINKIIIN
jgi:hypothetical protein